MSIKSKFLLVVVLAVMVVVGGAFVGAKSAAADCSLGTVTLRVGSTGTAVSCLQTIVGATADGNFGPMTKASVMAWQSGHGLVADGVVGPLTKAAMGGTTGSFPAGCTSNTGYSTTTGLSCASTSLPAGCTSTSGYSPTTGAKCDGGSTSSGPLTGGAGTLEFTGTTTNTESNVKEGATEKVLAFKAEADGSDIEVTNLKVVLQNDGYADLDGAGADTTSSEKMSNYMDSVSVYMGDEKVGSVDVDEFSKDSGNPDTFSKTIALDGAIVRDGEKETLYVAVEANSNIDSVDMDDADWNVEADTIRYTDATGIVLSESLGDNANFGFEDATTDDQVDMKSSTTNPNDATVEVKENTSSDEYLDLAYKLDVDESSSDVDVTGIQVTIDVTNFDSDGSTVVDGSDDVDVSAVGTWIDSIVDSVIIKAAGGEFEADMDDFDGADQDLTDGAGTVTYTAEIDSGDLSIGSGDIEDVKVYLTFNDQVDNYNEGVTVQASVDPDFTDAETSDDEIDVGGSTKTGAELTLRATGADFSLSGTPTAVASGDNDQNGTFTVKFDAEAFGDDIQIPKAALDSITWELRDASDDSVFADQTDVAAGLSVSLTSGADLTTDNDDSANAYLVTDTETFTVKVILNNDTYALGAVGQYYLALTGLYFYPNESDPLELSVLDSQVFQTDPVNVGQTP